MLRFVNKVFKKPEGLITDPKVLEGLKGDAWDAQVKMRKVAVGTGVNRKKKDAVLREMLEYDVAVKWVTAADQKKGKEAGAKRKASAVRTVIPKEDNEAMILLFDGDHTEQDLAKRLSKCVLPVITLDFLLSLESTTSSTDTPTAPDPDAEALLNAEGVEEEEQEEVVVGEGVMRGPSSRRPREDAWRILVGPDRVWRSTAPTNLSPGFWTVGG